MPEPAAAHVDEIARALRERRTIHEFTASTPPDELIREAIDIARWAPNHHRTEPWYFYSLDRPTGLRIADLNSEILLTSKGEKIAAVKRKRWSEIPGWLVVSCTKSDDEIRAREDYAACACAVQNMSVYLWSKGVGMKWTTGAVTRDRRFFDIVGIDYEQSYVSGCFGMDTRRSFPHNTENQPLKFTLVSSLRPV